MLKDIVKVKVISDYKLHVTFEDGVSGIIDVAELIPFKGVFEPLASIDYFKSVALNQELGVIQWPNGADLDPDVLYMRIKKQPVRTN